MVTIRDVAKRADVSLATVSHVINGTRFVSDDLRHRVLTAMDEMGYRRNAVARSLRHGKTQTIGLILPDTSNPFFAEIGRGIENAAFSAGYNLIICNSDNHSEKEQLYIKILSERQVDGIILDTEERNINTLHALLSKDIPVVLVDRDLVDNDYDIILPDNKYGGYVATKHLIELGHKRIGCITGHEYMLSTTDRLQGYNMALDEAGMLIDQDLIIPGDFRLESGRSSALKLLCQKHPPSAIFAFNDMMAIGVLRATVEKGIRVPDDLAVIGFDNIELSNYTNPALTTMMQPKIEIGQKAVQRLINKISDNTLAAIREIILPILVIRESTKARNEILISK